MYTGITRSGKITELKDLAAVFIYLAVDRPTERLSGGSGGVGGRVPGGRAVIDRRTLLARRHPCAAATAASAAAEAQRPRAASLLSGRHQRLAFSCTATCETCLMSRALRLLSDGVFG